MYVTLNTNLDRSKLTLSLGALMSRGFQDWRSLLMALDRRVFSSFSWTLLIEGMSNMMTPVFIPTLSYQGDLYEHFQKKRENKFFFLFKK